MKILSFQNKLIEKICFKVRFESRTYVLFVTNVTVGETIKSEINVHCFQNLNGKQTTKLYPLPKACL